MSERRFDVLGIGNAIVDILGQATDSFLNTESVKRGVMTLVDETRATELLGKIKNKTVMSGGSAASNRRVLCRVGW